MATLTLTQQRTIARAVRILETHYKVERRALSSPNAVRDFLWLKLAGIEREEFHVVYLDATKPRARSGVSARRYSDSNGRSTRARS
jgi:DNA repair protein RadC